MKKAIKTFVFGFISGVLAISLTLLAVSGTVRDKVQNRISSAGEVVTSQLSNTPNYEPIYTESQIQIQENIKYSEREVEPGIEYSSGKNRAAEAEDTKVDLKLDVFIPPNPTGESLPLAIVIHGGSFTEGHKEQRHQDAMDFAVHGYVAASIDYRLTDLETQRSSEERQVETAINSTEDAANAIRFLKLNSSEYNIDTDRICTVGRSAGGFISIINAVDSDSKLMTSDYADTSSKVSCSVATGAALTEEQFALLEPDTDGADQMILYSRTTDPVVGLDWEHAARNAELIEAAGIEVKLVKQPADSHIVSISPLADYGDQILEFMEASFEK